MPPHGRAGFRKSPAATSTSHSAISSETRAARPAGGTPAPENHTIGAGQLLTTSLALLLAVPSSAEDTIQLDSVNAYTTIESASVIAIYSGDENQNAQAHIQFRQTAEPSFSVGHPMVRLSGSRLAGSVLFLDPETEYEIRVVAHDPDNGGSAALSTLALTRPDRPPASTGRVWHVDASEGSDSNPGTSALPLATIQSAAGAASPGDTVSVRPGHYREEVTPPHGGAPDAPIRFLATGKGVVLDGSDPIFDSDPGWNYAGGNLYWTPYSGQTTYLAVGDTRVYEYQTLDDLQQENGNIGIPGALPGGFYVDSDSDRLYLITPDYSDPSTQTVHVAALAKGFFLSSIEDVVIEGFEIRYFNDTAIDLKNTARCWIRGNTIHHVNAGVKIRGTLAAENVVETNSVRDTSVFEWPWESVKSHTPEQSAIKVGAGFGHVIRWNRLEGTFDGVYTGSFTDFDEEISRDVDVYRNSMRFHNDDAMELEGAQRNVRYWLNSARDSRDGMSIAPVMVGPSFLVRNLLWHYTAKALAIGQASAGWLFVYHTTAIPSPGSEHPDAQAFTPHGFTGPLTMRNNIWEANRYVIEHIDSTLPPWVDFDSDNLWTHDTEQRGRFVKWQNVRYPDIASLAASQTIEQNGFQVRPQFEDPVAGDFSLKAGHALLDAGEVINGINDSSIVGARPDVGAFERGGVRPGPTDVRAGGSVSGSVFEAGSGSPIGGPGNHVLVYDSQGQFMNSAEVQAAGDYELAGLSAGQYFLRTNTIEHLEELFDGIPCSADCDVLTGDPVTVALGSVSAENDFLLFRGCSHDSVSELTGMRISMTEIFTACSAIIAGPSFAVAGPAGDVTLIAPSISLRNGFSIEQDGRFTVLNGF